MDSQKDILHDVVSAVALYAAPPRNIFYKRHALAQQFFVGSAVASLGGYHQNRPLPVTFRDSLVWNRPRHRPCSDFRFENGTTSMSSQSGGIDAK
jgi:hypothetical protein